MNDSQWDSKLKAFLQKTGEDFKRFGNDVKAEAQKLMTEVQDPARQQKLREGLKDVGVWARKTAEEVATLVETGVKKAEGALTKAGDKVTDFVARPVEASETGETGEAAPPPAATPPSPPPEMDDEAPAPAPRPKVAKKTVGKAPARKKPVAKKPAAGAKKTIGRKG